MKEINDNKTGISIFILTIIVVGIGISFAFYSAIVHGTGNTNAETSANTATLGEVEFNGTSTFDSSTLDKIYPGFIGVQTFTVGPYKNGVGIYEIDLAANVPGAFGNDIKITLYKTSNSTNNYIEREEGSLTIVNNRYTKQDILNIVGEFEPVYEGSLVQTDETMLEQVEFVIANNAFTNPTVTPDGYYTYYVVYEYLDNGNQNSQQGLDFDSKITVKYISELYIPESLKTLNYLNSLNDTIYLSMSTNGNPNFNLAAPQTYNAEHNGSSFQTNYYITYSDKVTYDENTGHYTLVDYTVCLYSECYEDLVGKYIIYNDYFPGSSTNTPIYESLDSKNNIVWFITEALSSGGGVSVKYKNDELKYVLDGSFKSQPTGVYAAEDDYGTSYYFRGYPQNNYVKFGEWQTDYYYAHNNDYDFYTSLSQCENDNDYCEKIADAGDSMYWRIVRINGDGSIRLIYDGINTNNDWTYDNFSKTIGKSYYNTLSDDNAYVGYMYGTPGSNTYDATHDNIHNSTVKQYVDDWYYRNLNDTNYENYIVDSLFCNDRSITEEPDLDYPTPNNGFNNNRTNYAALTRISAALNGNAFTSGFNSSPTLKCANKNDRFTVDDTTIGNGALTYPIGLITIDESNMAGVTSFSYQHEDDVCYLRVTDYEGWLTMSPANNMGIYSFPGGYSISVDQIGDNYKSFVRPVINISREFIQSGDGTASNPFSGD